MSRRLLFFSATVFVLLCSTAARSQEPAAGPASAESATAAAKKKAIELLGSIAGQLNTLHSAENRARIGSNVAELLWSHDEKRARDLFAASEGDINARFINTNQDESRHEHNLFSSQ